MGPGPVPQRVRVPRKQWPRLQALTRRRHAWLDLVVGAWMVIWLSYGHSPSTVGRLVGRTDRAVRKWRARWVARPCLESLLDAPRSGRPPTVPLVTRCEIVKLACERPAKSVAPFRCVFRAMAITRFGPSRSPIGPSRSPVSEHPDYPFRSCRSLFLQRPETEAQTYCGRHEVCPTVGTSQGEISETKPRLQAPGARRDYPPECTFDCKPVKRAIRGLILNRARKKNFVPLSPEP